MVWVYSKTILHLEVQKGNDMSQTLEELMASMKADQSLTKDALAVSINQANAILEAVKATPAAVNEALKAGIGNDIDARLTVMESNIVPKVTALNNDLDARIQKGLEAFEKSKKEKLSFGEDFMQTDSFGVFAARTGKDIVVAGLGCGLAYGVISLLTGGSKKEDL